MINAQTMMILECDWPDCQEAVMLFGAKKEAIYVRAKSLGWTMFRLSNGNECRCPEHAKRKRDRGYHGKV